MKINESNSIKKVSFQGHQPEKNEVGEEAYRFNCFYDRNKYTCEVEFYKVGMDKKNNFFIEKGCDGTMEPFHHVDVGENGVQVDAEYDLGLEKNEPFAYKFKLTPKDPNKKPEYVQTGGTTYDGCVIVPRRGTSVSKQGPMCLAIADTFAPGYVYAGFNDADTGKIKGMETKEARKEVADKLRNSARTFSNTIGGTIAGIEEKLPELRNAGCKRIITCPLKGGDNASSHKYWNENNYIMAGGVGNLNNYNSLQRKAFRYGMNLVDDGTFTSEGLQGVHFQRAIKWFDPDNKPDEYYMFRMSGLQDDTLGLGVVPANYKNLRLKPVNAPHDYVKQPDGQYTIEKNELYDPNQPTYIQIYDDSMVTDEQRKDKVHVINKYDKVMAERLGANTHDDTPIPYKFVVNNPIELDRNIKSLNEVNKMRSASERIDKDSPAGAMFLGSLSDIKIAEKTEGGFVCWDANTDMVKLNYFTSNYDDELLASEKSASKRAIEMDKYRRANYQVQDMTLGAGRYWTRQVRNTHNEYVAKTIGEISSNPAKAYERIEAILNSQNPENPILPEDVRVSKAVVENVINGDYNMREKHDNYNDLVISTMMDLPLDSLEFANDTAGALSSPYISKRSPDKDHLGQSRFDAMNDSTYKVPKKYEKTYNKMTNVYTQEMKNFADKVLKQVNENSKEKLMDENGVTEYGQYVIPLVAGDIAKYALIKSLMPSIGAKQIEGGEIAYDYDKMKEEGSLMNLGINGDSQEDEANQVVNKIAKGVNNLQTTDVDFVATSINKRIKNTNANSFKLAEVMVDRSGLGLDWRLDAAKDIADMDSVKNIDQTFDTAWKNVVRFWGNFVDVVKEENPNSYIVAEITDVGKIINNQPDDRTNITYNSENKAMNDLFNIAGITSEANYSYFFDSITSMFALDFTKGSDNVENKDSKRVEKLDDALNRFIQMPIDYQRNSYVFASNHDKPRMIHFMSMDMDLYHSNLKPGNNRQREIAYLITQDKMELPKGKDLKKIHEDPDMFGNVSAKAIANGALLRSSIGSVNEQIKNAEIDKINKSNKSEDEKRVDRENTEKKYKLIYEALSGAVADVVNGKYYKSDAELSETEKTPDSLKKINEKDGFGTEPIPSAFEIIYDQAVHNKKLDKLLSGEAKEQYKDAVYNKATEIGRAKTRIITRYLNALSGNPTIYAGDEGLAMTGGEEKCQNVYLRCREGLDWSLVDEESPYYNETIKKYRDDIYGITKIRLDDNGNKMEALNNGTMTKLVKQNKYIFADGKDDNKECPAVIYQAGNGAMNISLFNPNGLSTSPYVQENSLHPNNFSLEGGISLAQEVNGERKAVMVTPGTVFKNVINENIKYKVFEDNGNYFIKQDDGSDKGKPVELNETTAPDGVLMLYYTPENLEKERTQLTETKKQAREYYNKQHNIAPANAYPQNEAPKEEGKKLDVQDK